MKRSKRLSVALHVLVHLAERPAEPMSSEELARCVRTNPVVIRRTLAGLREAGFVESMAGHGGGWRLAREARHISLSDVCVALGEQLLFAIDLGLESGCRVQGAVGSVMNTFLADAEALLMERLGRISLVDLAAQVQTRRDGALNRSRRAHVAG